MNVLVCFKVVPDLDKMSAEDWDVTDHLQVDTTLTPSMINPYDESALEMALKLRDAANGTSLAVTLTGLTIDAGRSVKILKNLLALKYDRAVRVDCDRDLRFNSLAVSEIIYQFMQRKDSDQVILFGSHSNEGENGKTPLLVAEKLGVPCIAAVTGVKPALQRGCLEVTSRIEDLTIMMTVMPPAVLVVGNAPNTYIRVPTLKDKVRSSPKQVEVYSLAELGLEEVALMESNDVELLELFPEHSERYGVRIQGESPAEKAQNLYENYFKKRVHP